MILHHTVEVWYIVWFHTHLFFRRNRVLMCKFKLSCKFPCPPSSTCVPVRVGHCKAENSNLGQRLWVVWLVAWRCSSIFPSSNLSLQLSCSKSHHLESRNKGKISVRHYQIGNCQYQIGPSRRFFEWNLPNSCISSLAVKFGTRQKPSG